ncbi:hypothetical protein [Mesoflavibacter sp. CH_XMU1404-2]|uniref:hypothetical protein n=1 Tax=Mesoflavibacter sp. CH_XMU1404-2 TaxID=3107766 RepID=UPI00300B469D
MSNVVKQGQSFVDKVVELTGSFENVVAMAVLNNKSITDHLTIGEQINAFPATNKRVASFFNKYNEPATGLTVAQVANEGSDGIGDMIIGTTFIVE